MPRSPRSRLSALNSIASVVLTTLIASGLAVGGASPAVAEEVPPAPPVVEATVPAAPTDEEYVEAEVAEGASIQGTVTIADGTTAGDVTVYAYRHNGDEFEYTTAVVTADGGAYVIDSLQPGTYTLQFNPPSGSAVIAEWWDDRPNEWSADSFEVADGSTVAGMDALLAVGGAIEGVVSGPGGVSMPDATVTAYAFDHGYAEYRASSATDESGAFSITALPEGTYTLQFSPPWDSALSGEWWNDKPDQYSADTFSVVGGETVSGLFAELAAGGTISGAVTGSDGVPLKEVVVSARGSSSGTWASAFTDGEGRYEITGLAADDYTISFDPDAFEPGAASGYLREYWDDKQNQFEADLVVVAAGDTVTDIDAQLASGGTITGVVTAGGTPIEGVDVSVSGPGWGWATTDADGRYEVVGLTPGSYDVWFTMPSGSPYFSGGAQVQVTAGGTAVLDYTPESAASVRGRVTIADSETGVSGAKVTLYTFGGPAAGSAMTDADGNYSIAPVEAGRYLLEVSAAGIRTTWTGGSPTRAGATVFSVAAASESVVDVAAPAVGASGAIVGTVSAVTIDGTGPAAGATVELHTELGLLQSTAADADGAYRFEGVDAGRYAVRFKPWEWSSSAWWWDGTTRDAAPFFEVGATDTVTHDFTLPGFGSISATLAVDGTYTGYIRMEAVDAVTGEIVAAGSSFDGNEHTLWDVPAGDVKVRFAGPIRDSWWGGAADFASAATLTVPVGGEARADASLLLDTVLSGVVFAPDGSPLAGASVLIRPDDGTTVSYYATTDDSGLYRVTGLEAGRYTLTAGPGPTGASTHEPVIVDVGADVAAITQDLQLAQDVRLAGTLTYLGQPVEGCLGARIVGAPNGDGICTDSSGAYEYWLRPGEYDVSFRTTADVGAAASSHRVSIAPGQSGTVVLDPDLETGGVIEGTITADLGAGAEPMEGVWVTAGDGSRNLAAAVSGADGTYRLWGLQNGVPHTVQFGNVWNDLGTEWWDGASTPGSAATVVPGPDPTTGIDAELTRGGAITGRVTDAGGLGASFATVEVYSVGGDDYVGEITANIQGAYLLTGLATGDYALRFRPREAWTPGHLPEWWQDAGSAASAAVVTVVAGQEASGIDAALNEVGTVAVELTAPQVAGTPRVGETVAAIAASTTDGASLAYEWLADDAVVADATGAAFVLTSEQAGKRMSVRVTASADGYLPTTLTSPQTDVVATAEPDPTLPRISGTPVVGAKLDVDPGEKSRGTAFSYQWYADGTPIADATEVTLRLTAELEGAQIEVQVTTLRRGIVLERRTSEPTLRVLLAGTPTVSGQPAVGSTLTADPGTWTAGTQHAYRWYADGEVIEGATAATLDLTSELVGARIGVRATGHLPGYPVVERSSSEPNLVVRG